MDVAAEGARRHERDDGERQQRLEHAPVARHPRAAHQQHDEERQRGGPDEGQAHVAEVGDRGRRRDARRQQRPPGHAAGQCLGQERHGGEHGERHHHLLGAALCEVGEGQVARCHRHAADGGHPGRGVQAAQQVEAGERRHRGGDGDQRAPDLERLHAADDSREHRPDVARRSGSPGRTRRWCARTTR